MLSYLQKRPIAVTMIFAALLIAGLASIPKIPVSLLPDADVPQIIVRINYPNTAAASMEKDFIKPVRDNLAGIAHLKDLESRSANHSGLIYLSFEQGTRMDLAYIEINEKLDRLMRLFPADMERPDILKVSTSDIPVLRIQVTPAKAEDYVEVSALAEKVLKRRIEQIEDVSLVDVNGLEHDVITVTRDEEKMRAAGIDKSTLLQSIKDANRYLGGLSIKDGPFRYFIKVKNQLGTVEDISQLPIRAKNGTVVPLSELADVGTEVETPVGYHLYNGKQGIVLTVQMQPGGHMNLLVPALKRAVDEFRATYPRVEFNLTQDQTFLLDAGISNLYQDLVYGGGLTVALLFLFLGNWSSPSLMSISIPLSLVLTFIFFYLFHLSFNIISLSGLALGIGMLIDNSIVVVDNITRKSKQGLSTEESSVEGVKEVMVPVISQVLTTVAVYAPLILLDGLSGVLVKDQSIALTISLTVSLLVAFILAPLLYGWFSKGRPAPAKEDTLFYTWVARHYHVMIHHILKHKRPYFLFTLLLMPLGICIITRIPVSSLPRIEKKESLWLIDWNEPIDARANLQRIAEIQDMIRPKCLVTESEIGIRQFLITPQDNVVSKSDLYFACTDEPLKIEVDSTVLRWISRYYPLAQVRVIDAPNAFTQLFVSSQPYLEARFRPVKNPGAMNAFSKMDEVLRRIPATGYSPGEGMMNEPELTISLDYRKMSIYGVSKYEIENTLGELFGNFSITELQASASSTKVRFKAQRSNDGIFSGGTVIGTNGIEYPLEEFVSMGYEQQPKYITADKSGPYQSLVYGDGIKNIPALRDSVTRIAAAYGFSIDWTGQYLENNRQITTLWIIFCIVLFLLYFILAVQYEDLLLPLIVMLTIPLGVGGGLLLLWLSGGTLDVMAAVGFVVILGLIVDDPILKIETLSRIQKDYASKGLVMDDQLVEKMLHEAGDICLKPLLMVSLTTSIAMVPVLCVGGIGNDLQKPLALVIIGGLTIGTFFSTWFIPLAYCYLIQWRNRSTKSKPDIA